MKSRSEDKLTPLTWEGKRELIVRVLKYGDFMMEQDIHVTSRMVVGHEVGN